MKIVYTAPINKKADRAKTDADFLIFMFCTIFKHNICANLLKAFIMPNFFYKRIT